MRLSKTAWWILGIGFFVLAGAVMLMLYIGNSGDVDQLKESLTVNQGLLIKLTADREAMDTQLLQLEDQIDDVQVAYNQSKANFAKTVLSVEYDEELFSIAADSDLEVMSLTTLEPYENTVEVIIPTDSEDEEDTVNVIIFQNTVFEVEVRGTVPDILTFIYDVTNGGYFDSADVELITLEVPEAGANEQPSATMKIIIYSYEGE